MERVATALGALEQAETRFERSDDVPHGGVLCALAALLSFGLLRHAQSHFSTPKGFYPVEESHEYYLCGFAYPIHTR